MPTLHEWRQFYDSWAGRDPRVASTGDLTGDADFRRLGTTIAQWLGLSGREIALDVGCASGTLTSRWAPQTASCTGVDFSAALVAEAEARHGSGGLVFRAAEAADLPFADASFDCVVCFNVLLSLPDHDYVRRAIAEILRVARPDARVVLGSLPDERCQQRFFDVLARSASLPRRVGMTIKRWLRPDRPRRTKILWFDIAQLAGELRQAGWQVTVHEDPQFSNYRYYRKTLVLRRGAAGSRA